MAKNSYIVDLFEFDDSQNRYKFKDSCVMTLEQGSGNLIITSDICKDKIHVSINIINDDVAIISREKHHIAGLYKITSIESNVVQCIDTAIDYVLRYKNFTFGVRFDTRSTSSANHFFGEYTKIRTTHRFIEKYESGRIKLEGSKINKGPNGLCIEYYDLDNSPIKYVGQFEDGKYDGEGEFYSDDGNIKLHCKNICAGVPNGNGFLVVGRNKIHRTIQMKQFKHLKSISDTYTNDIYATLEPDYGTVMNLIRFEALSLEDRTLYLFGEIQKLKMENIKPTKESIFNIF